MLRYTLQRREKSGLKRLLISSSSELFNSFLPGSGLSWGRGWIQHWKNLMLLIWARVLFEFDIKKSLLDSYSQQLVRLSQPLFFLAIQVSVSEARASLLSLLQVCLTSPGMNVRSGSALTEKPFQQFQTPAVHPAHPAVPICHSS